MPETSIETGSFFDVDPENWSEFVDIEGEKEKERQKVIAELEKAQQERKKERENRELYWKSAIDLVNTWAKYNKAKKDLINATHEETAHRVWNPLVEPYYGGSLQKMKATRDERSALVNEALANFALACSRCEVQSVSRDWLHDHLKDGKDYARYRDFCKRRLYKLKPPESLRDF